MTTAGERLDDALLALAENGERPPCHGSPAFTSDDRDERAAATVTCRGCPIAVECGAAADENDEKWHVWGGRDRTPRQTTKARTA